jgi:RNA polymerase sigma-70 factor (ECF subfamily)
MSGHSPLVHTESGPASAVPAPGPPETRLDLDAVRRGEAAALGEVYRRHAGGLLVMLRGLLASEADAEDVLHDVFLGLPGALRRYEERDAFGGWLRRVAARVALERLRTGRRRGEVGLAEVAALASRGEAEALPDRLLVEAALAALPDTLRVVVVLRELEGWSHRDIARFLGLREGAVMTRHSRAMARLRTALEGQR